MMKIEEMTDEHLVNRIAWVKRNMPDHWKIHGDELPSASFTRALIDEDIEKAEAHIKDMETELDKRKKGRQSYDRRNQGKQYVRTKV